MSQNIPNRQISSLVSIAQACRMLGATHHRIEQLVKAGALTAIQVESGRVLIRFDTVAALANRSGGDTFPSAA